MKKDKSKKEEVVNMEETVEVTTEVEASAEETVLTPLEQLEKDILSLREELQVKEYVLEGEDASIFTVLLDFLKKDAAWKGQEAMGVVRATDDLKEAEANYRKTKVIALRNLTVEALYYYLSTFQGVGYEKARRVHRALMAVSKLIVAVRTDNKKVMDLEQSYSEMEYSAKTEGLSDDMIMGEDEANEAGVTVKMEEATA